MNFENRNTLGDSPENGDEIVVHTFAHPEATHKDLQRRQLSKFKMILGMGAALIGYADRSNTQAAEPMNAFAVNTTSATSENPEVSINVNALTAEDIKMKLEQARAFYEKRFHNDLTNIEKSTAQARIMQARVLVPKLMDELKKQVSDFERVALNELLYKIAVVAGKHHAALQANEVLTPDDEFLTGVHFEKEMKILEDARKHPSNVTVFSTINEINAELKERKEILEAMTILIENPVDAERNQQVGDYIFPKNVEKSLPYLAKGTKAHLRIVASEQKKGDAKEWWSQSYNESDQKRANEMRAHALKLYQLDPGKYDEKDRAIFEGLVKSNQHLLKANGETRRVSIAVSGVDSVAPIATAAAAPKPEDTKEGGWINLTQAVDFKKAGMNGAITPDGQGGVLFKGKDVSSATLDYPFLINGEYDIAFEFTEISGTGTFAFVLPVGDTQCMIIKMNNFVGIDMVNGERAMVNKTKKNIEIKPGEPHKVLIQVRKGTEPMFASIKFSVDGEILIEHEGPVGDLSITKGWDRGKGVFAIGNHTTNVRVGPVGFQPQKGTMIVPKTN